MMRIVVVAFLIALLATCALAQVPNLVSYQGLLTLTSGAPVSNGSYDLKFELFNVPSGGSALWTETQSGVALKNGTFTVELGSVVALTAIFNQQLYIQVTALAGPSVGSPTLFPRTMLSSVPYSLSLYLPFSGSSSQTAANSVFAVGNSGAGMGITGSHDSTAGTAPGVLGKTNSTAGSALALEGLVTSSSPGGFSTAVRGQNNGTGGLGIGVWGSQNGSGWGVFGSAPSGYGVYGSTTNGTGVYGATAAGGYGVYGYSPTGYGMYGSATSGTGLYGFSHLGVGGYAGSDSSVGLWGYSAYGPASLVSWGPFVVVGSGDNSVQLPNDAVNSQEILDEPGVAASYEGIFQISGFQVNRIVDSVVITVPSSGKIVVQTTGYVNQNHTKGLVDNVAFLLSTDPNDEVYSSGVATYLIPDSLPSENGGFAYRIPFACSRIINAPSAGSYTIYLIGYQYSGDNSGTYVQFCSTIATYYPTTYGSTPVAQTPGAANSGGKLTAVQPTTQYETKEQFTTAKSILLQRTVDQLQARVQKLEALMQDAQKAAAAKPQTTPNQ